MKSSNKTNQSRENIERINPVTHVTLTVGGCVLPRDWTETQEEIADFRGKLRRKKVKKNKPATPRNLLQVTRRDPEGAVCTD